MYQGLEKYSQDSLKYTLFLKYVTMKNKYESWNERPAEWDNEIPQDNENQIRSIGIITSDMLKKRIMEDIELLEDIEKSERLKLSYATHWFERMKILNLPIPVFQKKIYHWHILNRTREKQAKIAFKNQVWYNKIEQDQLIYLLIYLIIR